MSHEEKRCTLGTVGDGDDHFRVNCGEGGFNATTRYEPLIIRGYSVSLTSGDEVKLVIDGKVNWLGEDNGRHRG